MNHSNMQLAQNGFTLVEMMMAMIISTILIVAIAAIMVTSRKSFNDGQTKLALHRDYSLVEQVLAKKIRGSIQNRQKVYSDYTSYTGGGPTQTTGSCLKLYYPNNDSVLIYKDGSDLKIVQPDLATTNLIPGVVGGLTFVDSTRSILTRIVLTQGSWSISDTLVDAFRNFSN